MAALLFSLHAPVAGAHDHHDGHSHDEHHAEALESVKNLDDHLSQMLERQFKNPDQPLKEADIQKAERLIDEASDKMILDAADILPPTLIVSFGRMVRYQVWERFHPKKIAQAVVNPVRFVKKAVETVIRYPKTSLILANETAIEPGLLIYGATHPESAWWLVPATSTHLWDIAFYGTVFGLPKTAATLYRWVKHGGPDAYRKFLEERITKSPRSSDHVIGISRISTNEGLLSIVLIDGGKVADRLPRTLKKIFFGGRLLAQDTVASISVWELEQLAEKHEISFTLLEQFKGKRGLYARNLIRDIQSDASARAALEELAIDRTLNSTVKLLPAPACDAILTQ